MLQDALLKEVAEIVKDVISKDTSGKEVSGATGYPQALPVVQADEGDESQFFPYFIVKLSGGSTDDDDSPWDDTVNILFGIYDNDTKNEGNKTVMVMIQRVIDRFASEPRLGKVFRAQQDMQWATQDEDTYPFFFGGVQIKFYVPKIGRKEPIYD